MTTRDSITIDLDRNAVEVATGYQGVGVFLTILGSVQRGKRARMVTIALPRGKADELARLLRMAGEASRFAQARRDNLTSTVEVKG